MNEDENAWKRILAEGTPRDDLPPLPAGYAYNDRRGRHPTNFVFINKFRAASRDYQCVLQLREQEDGSWMAASPSKSNLAFANSMPADEFLKRSTPIDLADIKVELVRRLLEL